MSRPARIRRKDLKRPDEFQTVTAQVVVWARTHQRTLTGAGAAFAVVLVAIAVFLGVRHARARDANADLARALILYRDAAKSAEAATQLAEVGSRWDGTSPGGVAQLLAAEVELRRDNVDSALIALQQADRRDWPSYLTQQALVASGYALDKKGQRAEAITKYADASKLGGPYTFEALFAEARAQESAGDGEKARALYERLRLEFPDSPAKDMVESKLGAVPHLP